MTETAPTTRQTIAATAVWTGEGPPAPRTIEVVGDTIAAVHDGCDVGADKVFRNSVITPGFVNAHVHLDLTFPPATARLDVPFTDWLLSMRDLRRNEGDEGLTNAAERGIEQSIAAGTTTLVDYDAKGASLAPLAASRIRRVVLREVITFQPDWEERHAELESFLEPESTAQEVRGLAPHAPYSVERGVFEGVLSLAIERDRAWSTHLAEQSWEVDFLRDKTGEYADWLRGLGVDLDAFPVPGVGPVEYVEQLQASVLERVAPPEHPAYAQIAPYQPLLVHANYLTDADNDRLAKSDAAIVFCPRSHAFFGHTPHDFAQLLHRGVRVCLGTDGLVSNQSLSMLDELRAVRALEPDLEVTELFRLITTNAHAALGQRLGTGTLEPETPADFLVWPKSPSLESLLDTEGVQPTTVIGGVWPEAPRRRRSRR